MKNKLYTLVLFILAATSSLFSYAYLYVQDPRSWGGGTGTIEEAVISIKPKGLFMECGLYLTFSARNLNFNPTDSLEVTFNFSLPAGSIVHDSWLWIEGEIIQGEIMDKWTAASIYEDIVKRRRDPSILYKRYNDYYELRIFPMAGNQSRKVKLTYLVPTQWSATNVIAPVPIDLLQASATPVSKFTIFSWMDEEWKNPQLLEFPNTFFKNKTDNIFGNYQSASLPSAALNTTLHFMVDSPLKEGIYLNAVKGIDDNFYQLAFLPTEVLNLQAKRKVAILLDYQTGNSTYSKQQVLDTIKSLMLTNLTDNDEFNIFYANLTANKLLDTWVPATKQNIENSISTLKNKSFGDYSSLPLLFQASINFIKANGGDGLLLLFANTDQFRTYESANALVRDIHTMMESILPIHIVDFQDNNNNYDYIGGQYYAGNDYLYLNLSKMYKGNYLNVRRGQSFPQIGDDIMKKMGSFIKSFDLHPTVSDGFTFARYTLNGESQTMYLNSPILQIGKFKGGPTFTIQTAGEFNTDTFSKNVEIDQEDIWDGDALVREMWTGQYIAELEREPQYNDIVSEIVAKSVASRVLSIYTAFLCLEPARGGKVCYDCMDESSLLSNTTALQDAEADTLFQAFPNPFNTHTRIEIKLADTFNSRDIKFEIYNVLGQVVRTFQPTESHDEKRFTFLWDGTDEFGGDVSSGTYFFVVRTAGQQQSLKLLLMK
ncbi:MAG: T9SS C-terminal target domain-containing protein [Calditrichaeota bacterium]|nr:MAG: T9SS C-terminal target domain-containing protein [Calditrichota bacterium]